MGHHLGELVTPEYGGLPVFLLPKRGALIKGPRPASVPGQVRL
jgi:hypothetical protein